MKVELVDVRTSADGDRYEVYVVHEDDFVKAHAFVRREERRWHFETRAAAERQAGVLAGQ
jgi:hypothetical protein